MKKLLLIMVASTLVCADAAWCAGKKKTDISGDPCPEGVHESGALMWENPYDNIGKCYKLWTIPVMQLLSRSKALLANGFYVDFGDKSAPAEGRYLQGTVKGIGVYKYVTASGVMKTVHALRYLSGDEVARINDFQTAGAKKSAAEELKREAMKQAIEKAKEEARKVHEAAVTAYQKLNEQEYEKPSPDDPIYETHNKRVKERNAALYSEKWRLYCVAYPAKPECVDKTKQPPFVHTKPKANTVSTETEPQNIWRKVDQNNQNKRTEPSSANDKLIEIEGDI